MGLDGGAGDEVSGAGADVAKKRGTLSTSSGKCTAFVTGDVLRRRDAGGSAGRATVRTKFEPGGGGDLGFNCGSDDGDILGSGGATRSPLGVLLLLGLRKTIGGEFVVEEGVLNRFILMALVWMTPP